MTYYELLEVSETASLETIKAAYKAMAKKYHPDVFSGDPQFAEEKMKELNDAYEILSSESKRRLYDTMLKRENKLSSTNRYNSNSDSYHSSEYNYNSEAYRYAAKQAYRRKYSRGFYISPGMIRSIVILLIFAIVGIIGTVNSYKNDTDRDLTPIAEPVSGTILYGQNYTNQSEITVTAPDFKSCVVNLKTSSGTTKISFYVRAGETVTVGVPSEYLYLYFACGKTWYGTEHFFGKDTTYAKDSKICNFKYYSWEYELQTVNDGNVTQTYVNKDEFK